MTESGLQEKILEETSAASSGNWLLSYAILGIFIFSLADMGMRLYYHFDIFESPYRSWIYSALCDYPSQQPKPRIVIFGSSLMVAAVNDGDATTLGQEIDGTVHHRSETLERALSQMDVSLSPAETPAEKRNNILTQSFAIGGQMASDAYAILHTLFDNKLRGFANRFMIPRTIVWGIAPRDLMDATFSDPHISTTVTYLDTLLPNHDALGTRPPYIWRQLEYFFDSWFFCYGHRQHFVAMQKQVMFWFLAAVHLIPPEEIGTVKTPQELLLIARHELPEDNGIRQWMVKPQRQKITTFDDNSKEYLARYNPFKEKLFNQQAEYLDKFLATAERLGIKVTLINMPLTPENMALIPAGKYQLYLETVKNLARKNQAKFADFNDGLQFTKEYFNDPVHLNGYGSQRFFEMVARLICHDGQN